MKITVVFCLHGNERYGLEVAKKLPSQISFFVGNEKALKENKRFIDVDMNRCFPGKENGNYEEKQAFKLLKKLKNFDYAIDLHSSSNNCPLFGLITKPNKEKIELAKRLGLKRLIIMPEFFASGKALIDFVKCGISLEIGPHNRKENTEEVLSSISNLIKNKSKNNNIKIYEMFNIIKKHKENILIKNFQDVKKGQVIARNTKEDKQEKQTADFDFIAVFVNEKAYKGVLCLACKKLTKDDLQTFL